MERFQDFLSIIWNAIEIICVLYTFITIFWVVIPSYWREKLKIIYRRLFKQFRLSNSSGGPNGAELSIINQYTDGVVYREWLHNSELEGLYNQLKNYLEEKGIIDEENEET